ncbi:MAG: formate--tetrahydrofolate ligase [Clostridia bacterium]|nr:formate--tetrahydrofolate ligase [Clostridia bacterium]
MLTDIEIAQACTPKPIETIAKAAGIPMDAVEPYGRTKAKIAYQQLADRPMDGRLVLVTAINPTPAGEGKTTVSIGLADALRQEGINAGLALREPSLGPVFGLKGGATGGGYAQVLPMEEINLHFTGDMHAITAANNLICAMVDNSIQQGNPCGIDPRRVTIKRCMDMNDRQLRNLVIGLGGKANGTPREDGFDITTASEMMAVLCLADSISDLKARIGRMVVGRTYRDELVRVSDIGAQGAAAALLAEAIRPNLVQTLEGTPALIHGGPFANIAHGCNSVIATKTALRLFDVTVTEAGFGADLGAEKFVDIKCRASGLRPNAVVVVATVRALKYHGGVPKGELQHEDLTALREGLSNLKQHLSNVTKVWGLPAVVAVNRFESDTEAELELVRSAAAEMGAQSVLCEVWGKGGAGGRELARAVLKAMDAGDPDKFTLTYSDDLSLEDKIKAVAERIYHADSVKFAPAASKELAALTAQGFGRCPVCIAKTQYSFSDDPSKLGAPAHFELNVRQVRVSAGAGFVVALCGEIMTMPGLPKVPAAMNIDVDETGKISGLF